MVELDWIAKARQFVGLKEDKSKTQHNPIIVNMLSKMGSYSNENKSWWLEDETPWCGLFAGYVLGESDRYVIKDWYRARAWESDLMTKLDKPAYGCLVTFTREGGGHVGFVVGVDTRGNLMVLGGNQSNMVSIAPFQQSRVTGYYWPSRKDGSKSIPSDGRYHLPIIKSNVEVSRNES